MLDRSVATPPTGAMLQNGCRFNSLNRVQGAKGRTSVESGAMSGINQENGGTEAMASVGVDRPVLLLAGGQVTDVVGGHGHHDLGPPTRANLYASFLATYEPF